LHDFPNHTGLINLVIENLAEVEGDHFSVTHASRLDEALTHLNTMLFDVILLDLGLPDCIGLDAVISTHHQAPLIPIVVLAGVADDRLARGALHEGAQDYIEKGSLGAAILPRTIRYAIDRMVATQALRESRALLRSFYDSAPLMMGMVELD